MVKNSKRTIILDITYSFSQNPDNSLVSLYLSQGLETDDIEGAFYTVKATYGDTLIGGITLSKRYGTVILDYVAVNEEYKGKHIGKTLVEMALNHAKGLGINELFLVTKVEGFFVKLGAVRTEEYGVLLSECNGCLQYNTKCRPVLMKLKV